jgi:hypothetical protein
MGAGAGGNGVTGSIGGKGAGVWFMVFSSSLMDKLLIGAGDAAGALMGA